MITTGCILANMIIRDDTITLITILVLMSLSIILMVVYSTKKMKTIKEALLEAQKSNESKKDFISHLSHEIRTPMNAILGMTQIASSSIEDPSKVLNCLNTINYSSQKLLQLIDNILDTAKIDSDKLLLSHEPFYLRNTINTLSSLIQSEAEIKKLEYDFIYEGIQHDYLIGDSLRLLQILSNCLHNSLKFTSTGGKITFEIMELNSTDHNSRYRFTITDTGKGMHQEFLNQIFDPYTQEDSTINTRLGGCGLGMSIVKSLLDLMGGIIHVESQVDKGTKITIEILFEQGPVKNDGTEGQSDCAKLMDQELRAICILVVEDNEINLAIVCEFLELMKLQYDTVINGYEALDLFANSPNGYYDIILIDLQLPDINGYETTRRLRLLPHPDANKVTVIAMTADNFVNDLSYTECGMDGHIIKPIDFAKLNTILGMLRSK